MKKILFILTLLISGSLWAKTVATVNGYAIDSSQLKLSKNPSAQEREMAIEVAILEKLAVDAALKLHLDKSPEYDKYMRRSAKNASPVKKEEIRHQMLVTLYFLDYMHKHPITKKDIEQSYQLLSKQLKNSKEADVLAISTLTKADIDKAYAELKKGSSFSDVMKKYTVDTRDKLTGGQKIVINLNFVKEFSPKLYNEFNTLKKGGYTTPTQIDDNYVIFQLIDKHNAPIPTFEQAKAKISDKLKADIVRKAILELAQSAKVVPKKYTPSFSPNFTPF